MSLLSIAVLTIIATAVSSSPVCSPDGIATICTDIEPNRVHLDGDQLFVGSRNHLYTFLIKNGLVLNQSTELVSDDKTRMNCATEFPGGKCDNYITIIQPIPSTAIETVDSERQASLQNSIFVCGTNAYDPRCTVHNRYNISNWFVVSNSTGVGFSPFNPDHQNIGLLTNNGRFFSATVFDPVNFERLKIAVASTALLENATFVAGTVDNDDLYVGQAAEFVSLYEIGEYIFLFAREQAIETGKTFVYSRVFRICKTDVGIMESQPISRFLTFQKVRLTCPQSTYDYNEIKATFLHFPQEGGDPILYATFSSARNGPVGAAICKFSFYSGENSINSLFESTNYLVPRSGKFETESSNYAFSCPGESGQQRTDAQARTFQLVEGEVLPIGETTLHTKQGKEYSKIVVDVFSYKNTNYEAMFVGTTTGDLVVILRENSINETEATIFSAEGNNAAEHLILDKNDDTGIRYLVFGTSDLLADITLGNCSKYDSCVECLESRDPYCVWQNESNICANKLLINVSSNENTIEAIKAPSDVAMVCGVKLPSITVPPTTMQKSCTLQITATQTSTVLVSATSTLPTITTNPEAGGADDGTANQVDINQIGKVVGALIGGLLLGFIVGIIICSIVLALKRSVVGKSTNSSPSHSPTVLNGTVSMNNHISQDRGVVQYSIPVVLPEKQEDEKHPPPTPSISPPMIDSELEDDVISDLSPTRANSNSRPHARTLSTRPLMESYSDADP